MRDLQTLLQCAERIRTQQRNTKKKLYALHAPEVECISKGKARNLYEFGVKVRGEKLELRIKQLLHNVQKNRRLVRSFVGTPSVAYISDC